MTKPTEPDKTPVVLLAEDIPAEQQLVRRAIEKAGLICELHIAAMAKKRWSFQIGAANH